MAIKPVFDPRNGDEFILIKDFKDRFADLDLSKLIYAFDLLGWLHTFKITRKGVSCYDLNDRYYYYPDTCKIPFYEVNFQYETDR